GQTNPRLVQVQNRQAAASLVLAVLGWGVLLLALWPLTSLFRGHAEGGLANFTLIVFFGSLIFPLFALGRAVACIRTRARRLRLATCGLSLAGLHMGLCLGIVVLNIWRH